MRDREIERMIGASLVAGTGDARQLAIDRVALKVAASRHITCRLCGNVLDQHRTLIVETNGEHYGDPYCSKHLDELRESVLECLEEPKFKKRIRTVRILTWNGSETLKGDQNQ